MQVAAAFAASRAAPLCQSGYLENLHVWKKCSRLSRSEPRVGRGRHTPPPLCILISESQLYAECTPSRTYTSQQEAQAGSPDAVCFSEHDAGSRRVTTAFMASALLRAPEVQIHLL